MDFLGVESFIDYDGDGLKTNMIWEVWARTISSTLSTSDTQISEAPGNTIIEEVRCPPTLSYSLNLSTLQMLYLIETKGHPIYWSTRAVSTHSRQRRNISNTWPHLDITQTLVNHSLHKHYISKGPLNHQTHHQECPYSVGGTMSCIHHTQPFYHVPAPQASGRSNEGQLSE